MSEACRKCVVTDKHGGEEFLPHVFLFLRSENPVVLSPEGSFSA
jgi:hypothetical protein